MYRLQGWFNRTFRRKQLDAVLKEFKYSNGNLDIVMEHPSVPVIARALIEFFKRTKGVNFVEFTVIDHANMEPYTISIRKTANPTPSEINEILRGALECIANPPPEFPQYTTLTMIWMKEQAESALKMCGYR